MLKDLKYIAAYLIPLLAYAGIYLSGVYSFMAFATAFGIVPILDQLISTSQENLDPQQAKAKSKKVFFDYLLYLNVPLVYGLVGYFLYWLNIGHHETYEYVGMILSIGTVLGSSGINVAHELGHRSSLFERVLAEFLLLPSFYMHFIIEHNMGHHKHVSTPKDPSSSRLNEPLYFFWFRSTVLSYISAWNLEAKMLKRDGNAFWSVSNKMLWFTLIQAFYIALVLSLVGINNALIVILTGTMGFLLLETINYIEHYGLRRGISKSGGYERVKPKHSWNSNHEIGRIMLYELTRHSDHHYKSLKKYQILDHHDESPQLPLGYPGSMLMSLIPPLWFKVVNFYEE